MPKSVREELLEAYKIEAGDDESDTDLAARVATAINDDTDEEKYAALSDGARSWFEKAAKAMSKDAAVPALPGGPKAVPAKKAAAKKAAAKKEAPAKKVAAKKEAAPAKKAAAKKEAAPAAEKAPKKEKAEKSGRSDARRSVMRMLCKNPNITHDQIVAALEKAGKTLNAFSISDTMRQVRSTIECLRELGKMA